MKSSERNVHENEEDPEETKACKKTEVTPSESSLASKKLPKNEGVTTRKRPK